jgi:hypothetical protein
MFMLNRFEVNMLNRFFVYAVQERRTRISKRLRKLQELVPNMDKVTIKLVKL